VRSGAAAGHAGYYHESAFYDSDDEFVALVVPFLSDGVTAGEPTLVALGDRNTDLVRSALTDTSGLTFLRAVDQYGRPAATIQSFRQILAGHVAAGARQVRAVGEVPHPGVGVPWDDWARYEAVINQAYDDLPLWGLCPYDTRTTPDLVLTEVERTHPHLATVDGRHVVNDRYEDPVSFVRSRRAAVPDPIEAGAPFTELVDPTPAAARQAVADASRGSLVRPEQVDDLLIAVSEAVANAILHGRPPVAVRMWSAPDRVVVAVSDGGSGPSDPFAGLLPRVKGQDLGGFGLWLTHQLCSHVGFAVTDDGFTLRLVAGSPFVAS
jgi:anti-sigma regulatory factor (Ser/Thr protein kinase)